MAMGITVHPPKGQFSVQYCFWSQGSLLVYSKSEDDRYNYLDACQTMDGVWVVSQFPSWPVTLDNGQGVRNGHISRLPTLTKPLARRSHFATPPTTKVVEENCIFCGIDYAAARGYAPSRYQAGSAEMLALWGEQPVTPDSQSWIPKAVRHAL